MRLDRKATSLSVTTSSRRVARGGRRDGQKVLLALKNRGGEREAAWRQLRDGVVARGLATPERVILEGAPGLETALAPLWPAVPVQRCPVHKHRTLLPPAPNKLYAEISADDTAMSYAETATDVQQKRKAFLRQGDG